MLKFTDLVNVSWFFGFKNLSCMLIWINKLKFFNKDKKKVVLLGCNNYRCLYQYVFCMKVN